MTGLATAILLQRDGTRVHHIGWDWHGTIRVGGDETVIVWDGSSAVSEIGDEGPVCPGDVEIITAVYAPGTEVVAADCLGGWSGVVVLPAGTFEAEAGIGWRTATRVRVTDPAGSVWAAGQEVDAETSYLTATGGAS